MITACHATVEAFCTYCTMGTYMNMAKKAMYYAKVEVCTQESCTHITTYVHGTMGPNIGNTVIIDHEICTLK